MVLRLLKGESAESICRETGASVSRLNRWEAKYIAAGEAALERKQEHGRSGNSTAILQWLGVVVLLVIIVVLLTRFLGQPGE